MRTWIALLRGINVSGHKIMPMADLRALFEKLGFTGARTYIQTGNVVFRAEAKGNAKSGAKTVAKSGPGDDAALATLIEAGIQKKFGFAVPVIVRGLEELAAIVEANPWRKKKLAENERVHISYLDKAPAEEAVEALAAIAGAGDELVVRKTEAYILVRNGYGNTIFSNTLMEKKLKVRSTTRNLETSMKLIALAESP